MINQIAVRADDQRLKTFDREHVSGLCDDVLVFPSCEDLLVRLIAVLSTRVGCFAVGSVIDKCPYGNARCQLRCTAHVIVVIMGEQDIVNLADAGLLCDGYDAVGVTAVVARSAGVDKQRLARRRDEQCGLTALYIDKVDL